MGGPLWPCIYLALLWRFGASNLDNDGWTDRWTNVCMQPMDGCSGDFIRCTMLLCIELDRQLKHRERVSIKFHKNAKCRSLWQNSAWPGWACLVWPNFVHSVQNAAISSQLINLCLHDVAVQPTSPKIPNCTLYANLKMTISLLLHCTVGLFCVNTFTNGQHVFFSQSAWIFKYEAPK